jgi:phospholipid-binding lipoprotein MlaA
MKSKQLWRTAACALLLLGSACSTAGGTDPGRGFNEPVFDFNDGLDRYLLGPVARGWDWLMPGFVLTGVDNFFRNLDMPRTFVNDLFQAKPLPAAHDLSRFLVNSTVGVVGLVDVASMIRIQENHEDFGQTLGYWGTPAGAYMLLPVVPFRCTVRDWLAYPVDLAMDPAFVAGFLVQYVYGTGVVDVVNRRAINDPEIEENRREAIDWYVFVRDACLQDREGEVTDGAKPSAEEEEDLYDVEE